MVTAVPLLRFSLLRVVATRLLAFASSRPSVHTTLPTPYCLTWLLSCLVLTKWLVGLSMSFSQSSTGSTNGQGIFSILNNSQSLSSTPRATPPPPKGSQTSFGMSNGIPRGSFGGYDGTSNEYGSNMSYQGDSKPQIYRVRAISSISLPDVILMVLELGGLLQYQSL